MLRKVIQIVAAPTRDSDAELYSLCNDGTMWAMTPVGHWIELPAIPQCVSSDHVAVMYAEKHDLIDTIAKVRTKAEELSNHFSPAKSDIGDELLKIINEEG